MSNVNPKSFGPILIEDLIDQIAHPTGKWADYNCLYKAWIEYSRMTTFVSSNIMPPKPKVSDYSNDLYNPEILPICGQVKNPDPIW